MKKVLIFSHAMEIGGAERALSGLLSSFDYKQYQVDLFLMRHEGELMELIPKEVQLLPEIPEYTCLAVPILDVLKKKKLNILLGRVKGKMKAARFVKKYNLKAENGVGLEYSHKFTCKYMPQINDKEYDLAISFLTPHYFVENKVNAMTKIAWIHTDYSYMDIDVESELNMWKKYNYIASISDECTRGFCSRFPELRNKIVRIDNIIPVDFIREQANAFDVKNEIKASGSINLLSIGRFCYPKNFDNVPDICRHLLKNGMNVKWYLIGFGPDEEIIKEKIQEYSMEEYVIILGKKNNPYPYIKACDLYVQPSRYEGNCVCVHEAQILNKPVIISAYPTAKSQLENGVDGVIVPMDNEGCAMGIQELILNTSKQKQLVLNMQNMNYFNGAEVEKLYKLVRE